MSIGSAVRFKYGQSVVVHMTLDGRKMKMEGLVISNSPPQVSVHGIRLAFDKEGKVTTEGFNGAFIEEKEK